MLTRRKLNRKTNQISRGQFDMILILPHGGHIALSPGPLLSYSVRLRGAGAVYALNDMEGVAGLGEFD